MAHQSIDGDLLWSVDSNSAIFIFEAVKFHEN